MARPVRRLILRIAAGLAAVALLLAVALVALALFVEADRFRPRIERLAGNALGRPVALGRLHWDIGARITIESRGGSIANAPGFDGPTLASWRRAGFGLALRPLLERRVEINHLAIEGLSLDLQRDAAGKVNWSFEPPAGEAVAVDAPDSEARFAIGSVQLAGARVRWRDAAAARDFTAEALDLAVTLPASLVAPVLQFGDLSLEARLSGRPLPEDGAPLRMLARSVVVEPGAGRIELPVFEAQLDETAISGAVAVASGETLAVDGRLHIAMPSVRGQLQRFGHALPPMDDATVPGPLSLAAHVVYRDNTLALGELALRLDDTNVSGHVDLTSIDPLALRFDLAADRVVLDRYLEPEDVQGEPFELPTAWLKSLDAQGVLRIDSAEVAGAAAKQLVITAE